MGIAFDMALLFARLTRRHALSGSLLQLGRQDILLAEAQLNIVLRPAC